MSSHGQGRFTRRSQVGAARRFGGSPAWVPSAVSAAPPPDPAGPAGFIGSLELARVSATRSAGRRPGVFHSHEPWLVALSLLVAFQGSYVGLHLARGIAGASGLKRRQRITAAAISLALAVWVMHFVGMLALRLPVTVDYLVLPTLLSFLVCALVVGVAVTCVAIGRPSGGRFVTAAGVMGAGIVLMHYLGMHALHASLHMHHDPRFIAASVLVSVAASGTALRFGFGSATRRPVVVPAAVMALAISAMHYIAMAGTGFSVLDSAEPAGQPALSPGLLAVVVSIVAFLVSGLFLLSFVPETDGRVADGREADQSPRVLVPWPTQAGEFQAGEVQAEAVQAGNGLAAGFSAADVQAGPADTGAFAGRPTAVEAADSHGPTSPTPVSAQAARSLPVERDGYRRQIDLSRVHAVQAAGHYSQIFDGESLLFCPLPISEVEGMLDPEAFARVHRSHIVRLDRVAAVRRSGDSDLIALDGAKPYRVPVARARRAWLRQRLAEIRIA